MASVRREYRDDRPILPEIAAGAVVAHRGTHEVLLLYYRSERRWVMPKGHVDPGESLRQAAAREVREETGLASVALGPELAEVNYRFFSERRGLNIHKTSVYFLGWTDERTVRPEPIFTRTAWVSPAESLRRVRFENERAVLRAAREALRPRPRSARRGARPKKSRRG